MATSVIWPAWSLLNDDRSLLCRQHGFLQGVFIRIGGSCFSYTVHFSPSFSSQNSSKMVVCFSQFNFQLTKQSVALDLCFCLWGGGGGDLNGFHVRLLQHKCFSFIVVNKNICLRIYFLRSYSCKQFKLFFHNWRVLDWYKKYTQ